VELVDKKNEEQQREQLAIRFGYVRNVVKCPSVDGHVLRAVWVNEHGLSILESEALRFYQRDKSKTVDPDCPFCWDHDMTLLISKQHSGGSDTLLSVYACRSCKKFVVFGLKSEPFEAKVANGPFCAECKTPGSMFLSVGMPGLPEPKYCIACGNIWISQPQVEKQGEQT